VSLRRTFKAYPTLLRVAFAEAVAYRAEMFVWVLATTMPLIMMGLWTAVARDAPVGRFGPHEFTGYFLATFVARQLTGSWISWQMNFEVRQGTLALRLLRPIHPIAAYAGEVLAALPLRVAVAVPVALLLLATSASNGVTHDPVLWGLWALAIVLGWWVTYFVNVFIGALSLFFGSSLKLMEIYYALFFVFGGYTIPVELFPPWLRVLNDWLPFRYQIGVAVDVVTGRFGRVGAWELVGQQLGCLLVLASLALLVWNRGLRRFEAYGS
jgi:ABC-2 type transport system permease protein